jgi:hypothetical protein
MADAMPVGAIDDGAMTNTLICKSGPLHGVAIATKPERHLVLVMKGGKAVRKRL